ncbi:MAG: DMT family transporter [Pseudomonadota bacterium]
MKIAYLLAAVAIGMAFAVQPAINGAVARIFGSAVSAGALSVTITCMTCLLLIPFFGGAPSTAQLASLPWWVIFGGLIGVSVIVGSAAIAPATGAAAFFVCLIAGQVVGSAVVDQIGAFGMPRQPISLMRIAGLGLVVLGVVLIQMERS